MSEENLRWIDWWTNCNIPDALVPKPVEFDLDDILAAASPGSIIRVRVPAAEQIRKGWEQWSAYGTTY